MLIVFIKLPIVGLLSLIFGEKFEKTEWYKNFELERKMLIERLKAKSETLDADRLERKIEDEKNRKNRKERDEKVDAWFKDKEKKIEAWGTKYEAWVKDKETRFNAWVDKVESKEKETKENKC